MTVPVRRLLIAEDEADQLEVWRRDIEEFNKNPDRKFTFVTHEARSATDAARILDELNIDCAIIDLRLPPEKNKPDEAVHGNKLRTLIEGELPILVAIHTGHPGELDEAGRNSLMKLFTKDAGKTTEALEWFAEKAQLMEALAGTSQRIKMETAKVLHGSIWPRWEAAKKQDQVPERFDDIVTRQVVSHLAEQFSLPLEDVPAHHLHEFYYVPPMRNRLHTGDLVRLDDMVHVIVTPQCDIINVYPANFLLAKCSPEHNEWKGIEEAIAGNKGKISKTTKEKIEKFTTQVRSQRFHFLPPCGDEGGPWFVDFKDIITVDQSRTEELLKSRFASIAAPFVPNLVYRFAAFIGRIGQPKLDVEALAEHLAEAYQNTQAD